ncbi:MAG: FAD-binding protein, partial [Eggerthellaceae bacterium]|nr:FAD-binding protein [Eggerthellaceae bacterium]
DKYIPTAAMGCASSYLPLGEEGECFRMGLGVGADVSGFNSSASFDGGVDWASEGGQWARFLYDGMTQLSRQPFLTIDRCGNRIRYMDSRIAEDGAAAIYALGDLATAQMAVPGHRSYIVFDSNYEDHLAGYAQEHCRKLITPDLEQIEKVPEHYRDWHHGVQDAIDADVLKKRDSLEELEADLGLEPGILTGAVEKWNACCEAGKDDFMYPMPPEWLHAIKDPPFYGCRIGGNLYGTKCGLAINDHMQVMGTNGRPIEGLYAGWHTAGGAVGENSYIGDVILGSLLGDVSLAFCGGYLCGTFANDSEDY